jgi:hypothetical protein
LHVVGNQIQDAAGQVVQLRGVNISGQEFADEQMATSPGSQSNMWGGQPEDSPSTIAGIISWGHNAVRVPLNEDSWLGINPSRSPATYQAGIISFVKDLRAAHLYVILDLHWNAPSTVSALAQQGMADQDHSPAFWTSVAQTFSYDLGIALECYNEPFFYYITPTENQWQVLLNGGTLTEYLTGGSPYTITQSWQAMGMQAIITTIRATGAQNLILVGGADWCNDLTGWLAPTDPLNNFAVAWHAYPGEAHTAVNEPEIVALAAHHPIVVTETGGDVTTNTSDTANILLGQLLTWWDTLGISYFGWTWDTWLDPQDVLVTTWGGTPTDGYGQLWQAHILARAGLN